MRILIVEDQPADYRAAANAAELAGYTEIDVKATAGGAKVYLEKGLEGNLPLPDTIVLDLDLGYESGFEILRFWHGDPRLSSIPLVVWTILGEKHRDICQLFKVNAYLSKQDGAAALREALSTRSRAAS